MRLSIFKIIILSIILAFFSNGLYAQFTKNKKKKKGRSAFIEALKVQPYSAEVYLNLAADKIDVPKKILSKTEAFNKVKQKKENLAKPLDIDLQDGELIITYKETPIVDDQYNLRRIEAKLDGNPLTLPPEMVDQASGVIHWYGLAEQYPDLVGNLVIDVAITTWGTRILPYNVRCEEGTPTFTPKQKTPYWITGGLSLVAIGTGRLLRERSQEIYDTQYLTAENVISATPFYNDANKKRKQYLALTYVGGAIFLTDAILLIARQNRHKKRVQTYNELCVKPRISWQPMVDFLSPGVANAQVGLKMQFTF